MAEYIERESLLKIVDRRLFELRKEYGPFDHYTDGYDECIDRINEQPTADVVEVKHGEWIEHGNWWGHIEYECSACKGQTFDASEFAYCPHCGAKMDKRSESNAE